MEARKFTYPLSKLSLRFLPILVFLLIFVLATLRASQLGRLGLVLLVTPLIALTTILPILSLLAKYSSLTISGWGVTAQALGLVWRKTAWADVGYIQRVKIYRDLGNRQTLIGEVFYFGRGNKGTWRISFTPEIKGFEQLLKHIDDIAPIKGIALYALDCAPRQFGQVRAGVEVKAFSNLDGSTGTATPVLE